MNRILNGDRHGQLVRQEVDKATEAERAGVKGDRAREKGRLMSTDDTGKCWLS
jgi:hypothetical protein